MIPSPKLTAARQIASSGSMVWSSKTVPGVMTRVTSRFTSVPWMGASTWSQMATVSPAASRRATWPRAAW